MYNVAVLSLFLVQNILFTLLKLVFAVISDDDDNNILLVIGTTIYCIYLKYDFEVKIRCLKYGIIILLLTDCLTSSSCSSDLNWSWFDPQLLSTCSMDQFIYIWDLRYST